MAFIGGGLFGRGPRTIAVNDVSFAVGRREIVALIGASGSGKTTIVRTALGLQAPSAGAVRFCGRPVDTLGASERQAWRRRVQLIFQDPSEALNPRMTVQQILLEGLAIHRLGTRAERQARIVEALGFVGLAPADAFLGRHPHTLSGGQRQRVAIAAALVLEPELLVADEPVSMLDPSIRAGILELFRRLRTERGMSTLIVTHDLPSAYNLADRAHVMNRGRIVEEGDTAAVFRSPRDDYTRRLIAAARGKVQEAAS
ncbi:MULTISPECIES: ABC transporter ATP-binding protein [unclassified Devosia]|uniref:ABC transporter ATP-binding protein n=1 Tax=unclassified Devosia TaxID=196773 RepID=UPI001AC48D9E|nr:MULTISPECIES: ATP-binding cassette domain-containing protein [unclassified Devosia]MBN9306735.1 ABC transporter ATP-binding protein [Devosia sp.]